MSLPGGKLCNIDLLKMTKSEIDVYSVLSAEKTAEQSTTKRKGFGTVFAVLKSGFCSDYGFGAIAISAMVGRRGQTPDRKARRR